MSEHTPVPWTASPDGPYIYAMNNHGSYRLHCTLNTCSVYGDDGCHTPESEFEANRRLIAAAPELLAALDTITQGIFRRTHPSLGDETPPTWKELHDLRIAVLAKATQE